MPFYKRACGGEKKVKIHSNTEIDDDQPILETEGISIS